MGDTVINNPRWTVSPKSFTAQWPEDSGIAFSYTERESCVTHIGWVSGVIRTDLVYTRQ